MTRKHPILIAGVGNLLLSDDGVGAHVIQALRHAPPPNASLVEVGTAVLHGLSFVEGYRHILLIDAANGGHAPGTIYLQDPLSSDPACGMTSLHSMGFQQAAQWLLPPNTCPPFTLIGVEPATLDYGLELSSAVRAAVPRVLDLVRQLVTHKSLPSAPKYRATFKEHYEWSDVIC